MSDWSDIFPPVLTPLGPIFLSAATWHRRSDGVASVYAGIWPLAARTKVIEQIHAHTAPLSTAQIAQWKQRGLLPRRRTDTIIAYVDQTHDPTTNTDDAPDNTACADGAFPREIAVSQILFIFDHGIWSRANVRESARAQHIMRNLDDYHEPTLALLRRQALRRGASPDDALHTAYTTFMQSPVSWRDVVAEEIERDMVRFLRQIVDNHVVSLHAPITVMQQDIAATIAALSAAQPAQAVREIIAQYTTRKQRLATARWTLLYALRRYLSVAGMQHGRSRDIHLSQGIHLIFSDQLHQRSDFIADRWLTVSTPESSAGNYHFAETVPPDYAAVSKAPFRLSSPAAVQDYLYKLQNEEV